MDVFKGSLFLNLPATKLMSLVGITISFDLFVDSHKFQGLLHFSKARPVLEVRLDTSHFLLVQFALVDPPKLFVGKRSINHQDFS